MTTFCTLGPENSNHHVVVKRYLMLHGLESTASIDLQPDFPAAVARVLAGHAQFLVQCAVHPATPATVARFFDGLYLIDAFISPSRDLALLRRRDVAQPRTVAAMPATVNYVDLSPWGTLHLADTVAAVAQGLLEGQFDAGLTFASLATEHPGRFHIEARVPSVDDAWLVYGRERVSGGQLLAWPGSPAAALYRSG